MALELGAELQGRAAPGSSSARSKQRRIGAKMDVPNRPVTNGRSVMNQQQMLIVSIIVALIIGVLFGHYVWVPHVTPP